MSIRLLAFAATSLLPLWVQAADLPKQGSDTFHRVLGACHALSNQQGGRRARHRGIHWRHWQVRRHHWNSRVYRHSGLKNAYDEILAHGAQTPA